MGKKSKAAASSRNEKGSKTLSSVKTGSVVKSSQTPKSKSKEMAKKAAAMLEQDKKKSKQIKKKEPTPSTDSSDESMSDDVGQTNGKVPEKQPAKISVNGNTKAKKGAYDTSPSSSSTSSSSASESDEEVASKPTTKPKPKSPESSSDSESDSADKKLSSSKPGITVNAKKAVPANDEDSSETDTDSESDEEDGVALNSKPATVNGAAQGGKVKVKPVKDDDESDEESSSGSSDEDASDSDDASSDEEKENVAQEKPNVKKRAAEDSKELPAKKVKAETATNDNGNEGIKNLFVGNLSWNVDEEWLSREFGEFGELTGVRIISDRSTGRSKGFGYVEFANAADAAAALKAKNQSDLDGRAINVDFSSPRPNNDGERPNVRAKTYGDTTSPESDTLFVGNISFEATEDILGGEFGSYGTVTQVRLPTDKDSGALKGFGYVQFSTIEEAKEALKNMNGASICGRPIRLDFSTPRSDNNNGDSSQGGGRRGFGGRGGFGDRGGRGGRGGARGGRGGFGDRGGRGGRGRGGSTNRGGFGDFKGQKKTFA